MKLFSLLLLLLLSAFAEARRPNVVVILTDDQGWGDLSLNGNTNLSTPHIDSLAEAGMSFERFYVCPVCSPTRAEFLTGRYHQRGGVYSTSGGGERLDLDESTLAEAFKGAGYRTGAFGKWHNGTQFPYHPNGRGFDEFYGFCSGHWGAYFTPMLERNGRIVKGEGYVIDDFTSKAIEFIEEHRDDPFFVYLPYNTPHSPMQVPDGYWERFADKELTMRHRDPKKENDRHLRCALAMCENIDRNVGRVLAKLDELKLRDDTIVLFFCDNGPNGWRWNGGMKGKKGSADEGGIRSPLLMRWPGKIKAGGVVEAPAAAIDLLPTLLELTEVERVGDKPLDGISLKPLLGGAAAKDAERFDERLVFTGWGKRFTVRSRQWRLAHDGGLYDMEADPGQRRDVSKANPGVFADLSSRLATWKKEMIAEKNQEPRPFVIAHPGHAWTHLPARDAKAKGGVRRTSPHPNDSFFTDWTSTDDRITWDVEVAAEGTFEVAAHYTCAAEDVGSSLELTLGDSKLVSEVRDAFKPGLVGVDHDRSPRTEAHVQDWGRQVLGTIRLDAGKGTLTLRATEVPGKRVMDFRLLTLQRIE